LYFLVGTAPWLKYWLRSDEILLPEKLTTSSLSGLFNTKTKLNITRIFFSLASIFLTVSANFISRLNSQILQGVAVIVSGIAINTVVRWLFSNINVELENQAVPNQGIKDLWRNILFFIFFTLFITAMLALRFSTSIRIVSDEQISFDVISAYIIYIMGFSAFEGGGNSLLQHICLRIICAWHGYVPPRYDRLLDYCTERLLLQRIGGRYRFMHKLLQDHFAAMDLD
jgi:hypothetical protein